MPSAKTRALIGFTANKLNIMEISAFAISFVHRVVVCGLEPGGVLGECLSSGLMLGRHTDVVVMRSYCPRKGEAKFDVFKAVWVSARHRPKGEIFPQQCCKCLSIFSFIIKEGKEDVTATCVGKMRNGEKCEMVIKREGLKFTSEVIGGGPKGTWMMQDVVQVELTSPVSSLPCV
jgi:hypothetical protein